MAKSTRKSGDKSAPKPEPAAAGSTQPNDNKQVLHLEAEELPTVEEEIGQQIRKFNFTDAAIAQLKQEFGGLTIPENDKEAYEKVKKAWNLVRSKRTGLEKKGLELRNGYKVITTAIKGEEDRLIGLLTPLEDELYKTWKAVDDAKEAEKQRKIKEEEERLQQRLEELQGYGLRLKDGMYQLGDTISIDVATLRSMEGAQYEKLASVCKKRAEEMEEERQRQEQLKKQQEEEQQRQQEQLILQQQELEQQQEALRKQQEELEEQKREAANARRELRTGLLTGVGFTPMHGGYFKFQTPIMQTPIELRPDILDIPKEEFDAQLKEYKETIRQKQEDFDNHMAEAKRKEEEIANRKKSIAERLETLGLTYRYNGEQFEFNRDAGSMVVPMKDLLAYDTDEALEARIESIKEDMNKIIEAQQQADARKEREEEQQKQEQEREAEAQKDDKTKFSDYLKRIHNSVTGNVPTFKSKTYQQQARRMVQQLSELLKAYEND